MAARKDFVYTGRIRFSHTDPAGYVFFARYFEMFQAAIEDWFFDGLGEPMADVIGRGLGLPTAHTECSFHRPTRFGEDLDLAVVPERIGTTSITVRFEGSVGGEARLIGRSVLVLISLRDGRPVPVPAELRRKMAPYMDDEA